LFPPILFLIDLFRSLSKTKSLTILLSTSLKYLCLITPVFIFSHLIWLSVLCIWPKKLSKIPILFQNSFKLSLSIQRKVLIIFLQFYLDFLRITKNQISWWDWRKSFLQINFLVLVSKFNSTIALKQRISMLMKKVEFQIINRLLVENQMLKPKQAAWMVLPLLKAKEQYQLRKWVTLRHRKVWGLLSMEQATKK
jgi:hypothetical protein